MAVLLAIIYNLGASRKKGTNRTHQRKFIRRRMKFKANLAIMNKRRNKFVIINQFHIAGDRSEVLSLGSRQHTSSDIARF